MTNLEADNTTSGTLTIRRRQPTTFSRLASAGTAYATFGVDTAGAWTYGSSTMPMRRSMGSTTYTDLA